MKLKNILSKSVTGLGAAVILLGFSQCKDEDFTDYSNLTATNPTASVEWTAPASTTERDDVFPFTITLSEPQVVDVRVNVSVVEGGTATEGEDFDIDHLVIIPAGTTMGSGALTTYNDLVVEGSETFTIQIGDERTSNVNLTTTTYDVTLNNFVSNTAVAIYDWSGTAMVDGVERVFCDEVDIDVLIYDEAMMDSGNYDAATGDCPEDMSFGTTWADGTYYLVLNLWSNGIVPTDGSTVTFPMTVYLTRGGLYNDVMLPVDPAVYINSDDAAGVEKTLYKFVKSGTTYRFYDPTTDELLFEG